jgi:hypothetical protein
MKEIWWWTRKNRNLLVDKYWSMSRRRKDGCKEGIVRGEETLVKSEVKKINGVNGRVGRSG